MIQVAPLKLMIKVLKRDHHVHLRLSPHVVLRYEVTCSVNLLLVMEIMSSI